MASPMPIRSLSALVAAAVFFIGCPAAWAQSPSAPPATEEQAPAAVTPPPAHSVELDQTLITAPTTMPLGRHKSYFRLTHRFARDLGRGSFGGLTEDLFGLDNGAVIGLEYRFGLTSTIQAGIHRSILGKTIHTFGRWDVVREADGRPFSLSATASIEGQNNLRLDPQPGASLTISHAHGTRLAIYATPTYVHNAHTETLRLLHEGHAHDIPDLDAEDASDAVDTFFVSLGSRVRILDTVSLVAEVSPRLGGYTPDEAVWGVAIEKMTRGHVLQLNFGNSFSTTPGQVARGGARGQVFMGFNLSRKF